MPGVWLLCPCSNTSITLEMFDAMDAPCTMDVRFAVAIDDTNTFSADQNMARGETCTQDQSSE